MRDRVFDKAPVKAGLLHQELQAVLGDDLIGVSTQNGQVIVHLEDDANDGGIDLAAIVAAHDSAQLTVAEQFQADQAALFDSLAGKVWTDWTDQDKDDWLRYLAGQAGLLNVSQ